MASWSLTPSPKLHTCRLFGLQLLHMPVLTPDRELLCNSALMRRLCLNGRGVDREAHCCRLLWTCLASMCLQPPATAPAPTPGVTAAGAVSAAAGAAGVAGTSGATPASPGGDAPRGMRRQGSLGTGMSMSLSFASMPSLGGGVNRLGGGVNRLEDEACARAPWWALLDELCDSLATRLQGAAVRLEAMVASSEGAPGTALGAPGTALDLREPRHLSSEAAMRTLEAAALAEESIAKEVTDGVSVARVSVGAMGEAHARLEAESSMLSTLGLLVHACAENGEVALALTAPRWLRVLLATWHYASPRCMRLSMRLLAKVV